MSYSPDGRRILSSDSANLKIWDSETGQELFAFKGHLARVRMVGGHGKVATISLSHELGLRVE